MCVNVDVNVEVAADQTTGMHDALIEDDQVEAVDDYVLRLVRHRRSWKVTRLYHRHFTCCSTSKRVGTRNITLRC